MAATGTLTQPILHHPDPLPAVPENYPRGLYTEEQITKLDALHAKIQPVLQPASTNGDDEAKWCDDPCLLRYLRAVKWDVEAAVKRIESTLLWRREYQPHQISADEVEPEAVNGKEYVSGYDLMGRPLLYLIPRKEHTKTYDRQLRYVVYNLEHAIKAMPPGVEKLNILIDYEGLSVFTAPPASQAKKVLQILGDHYPERLGMGFVFNPSWYLWGFFKIISPFLDPITKSKIHFVNLKKLAALAPTADSTDDALTKEKKEPEGMGGWTDPRKYIAPSMLVADYGGTCPFVYNHEDYWKAIKAL
ncbi:hypothetical protein PhCBS80983_g04126 [Powellomyces hirtus]|uniref:CRAL-TRIO domain-containing protein n=1 Tax=Powellomyces hirtus TaxID=109895 RepID=A0A507E040_9FUNG|nr:hypothetical protein PhCBS80983_g04126 [Powellomyces hirtus]